MKKKKVIIPLENIPAIVDVNKLQDVFNGDTDLLLFYLSWLKNGLKAGKAYQDLHPEVTEHSARTLGSRILAKVDKTLILQAFGLDIELYMQQLKDGIQAVKPISALVLVKDDGGVQRKEDEGMIEVADHRTRKDYHDKLGKLLGIEQDKDSTVNVQVNNILAEKKERYKI